MKLSIQNDKNIIEASNVVVFSFEIRERVYRVKESDRKEEENVIEHLILLLSL